MNCPTCGNENPEEAQFCGECVASLNASTVSGIGIAATELPMVSFPQAIKLGFKNYFNFNDRATRAEFWWWASGLDIENSTLNTQYLCDRSKTS